MKENLDHNLDVQYKKSTM